MYIEKCTIDFYENDKAKRFVRKLSFIFMHSTLIRMAEYVKLTQTTVCSWRIIPDKLYFADYVMYQLLGYCTWNVEVYEIWQ